MRRQREDEEQSNVNRAHTVSANGSTPTTRVDAPGSRPHAHLAPVPVQSNSGSMQQSVNGLRTSVNIGEDPPPDYDDLGLRTLDAPYAAPPPAYSEVVKTVARETEL